MAAKKKTKTSIEKKVEASHKQGRAFNVLLSKVDERVLTRALEEFGLDTGGRKRAKVERLGTYYHDKFKHNLGSLVKCDTDDGGCGGLSDEDTFNCCPYCGASDEDAPEGSDELEDTRLVRRDVVVTEGVEVSEVRAVDVSQIPLTSDELDRRVKQFLGLKKETALGIYKLGLALRQLQDSQLWMLRTNDEGKQFHRSFFEFARLELGVEKTHVARLVRLASLEEDQVRELEPGHVQVLMKVPKRLLPDVVRRAQTQSPRQLREQARELAEQSRTERPQSITGVLPAEPVNLAFRKRPSFEGEDPAPARSIDEDPHCEVELENGVVLSIRITTNRVGEIIGVLDSRRDG